MGEAVRLWYVLHLRRCLESRCFDVETRQWVDRLATTYPITYQRLCVIAAEFGEQALLNAILAIQEFERGR